jgi:hypothetical protein
MSESGKHLKLVFNESGGDPIVLESSWSGDVNREPPNLTNIGQGKQRLRALCILLILAKYQQSQMADINAPQTFQVDIKKGTWICTIANDIEDVILWVKKRFHIHDNEMFLLASPGSTHNKGGKKYPLVNFYPSKLPLDNLHLFVRSAGSYGAKSRLLRHEELLGFAMKIEANHWKKSAIKQWNSDKYKETGSLIQNSLAGAQTFSKSDDAFYSTCMAEVAKDGLTPVGVNWKNHFDLIFKILMEREFESYRANCKPFFSYIGSSITSGKMPYFWREPTWNLQQISHLRDNCIEYCSCVHGAQDMFLHRLVGEGVVENLGLTVCGYGWNSKEIYAAVREIFNRLALKAGVPSLKQGESFKSSPTLLAESKGMSKTFVECYNHQNFWVALGAFFAQQIIFSDFLNEVCCAFFNPMEFEYVLCQDFLNVNLNFKILASQNKDLIYRHARKRQHFLNAVQGGRVILRAQSTFYNALHRCLIALEGKNGL